MPASATESTGLLKTLDAFVKGVESGIDRYSYKMRPEEIGTLTYVGNGIVRASGLKEVRSEELVELPGGARGMAFNLDRDSTSLILLDWGSSLRAGDEVRRSGQVMSVPVGKGVIGRVIDAVGRPLDGKGAIEFDQRLPLERPAPAIMDRDPVTQPLQTGLRVIDALIPIGRGQRELILGDRQIGKTAIAIDTIINQRSKDVLCIYCAIGQRNAAVAQVVENLRQNGAMDYTAVVVGAGEDPPGLQYVTPYAAMSMAEFFMERGRDVLVVFDDLTKHARAYRELSLLLRRPPAREAYPGDIFYIHSRLLERSTHLRSDQGGGSITALPIIETQAQNVSAFIPTNLISITDGQIYLNPTLYQQGIMPAVDVGRSVSRVGGKTQLPAYRAVAGDLRLSYSQFEELEAFARFGTRLDEDTKKTLNRGRKVRQAFKQPQYQPRSAEEQIYVLVALNAGLMDSIPDDKVQDAVQRVQQRCVEELGQIAQRIHSGEKLSEDDKGRITSAAREVLESFEPETEPEDKE